jgi:hypothetical protein
MIKAFLSIFILILPTFFACTGTISTGDSGFPDAEFEDSSESINNDDTLTDDDPQPSYCYASDGSRIDTSLEVELDTLEYWRMYYALSHAGCSTSQLKLKPITCNNTFYIAVDGDDQNNSGQIDSPLASIPGVLSKINPGDCIYLRHGTYQINQQITVRYHDGTENARVYLMAYPGEEPILDFGFNSSGKPGMELIDDYWHIKGLTFQNAPHFGLFIYGGNHNIIEGVTFRYNQFSGFGIKPRETNEVPSGILPASGNKVINCDSYENFDPQYNGENADGFEVKISNYERHVIPGPNNEFIGCRAWSNADDGWDFWYSEKRVTLDSCWAFSHGFNLWNHDGFSGNGNGFKFGKNIDQLNEPEAHLAVRCLAFGNGMDGFNENDCAAPITLINNTAWKNALIKTGSRNYGFLYHPAGHRLVNNLSYEGTVTFNHPEETILLNNSWQLEIEPSDNDFETIVSLEEAIEQAKAPRKAGGALPDITFMKPALDSVMNNAATTEDLDVLLYSRDGQFDIGAYQR